MHLALGMLGELDYAHSIFQGLKIKTCLFYLGNGKFPSCKCNSFFSTRIMTWKKKNCTVTNFIPPALHPGYNQVWDCSSSSSSSSSTCMCKECPFGSERFGRKGMPRDDRQEVNTSRVCFSLRLKWYWSISELAERTWKPLQNCSWDKIGRMRLCRVQVCS